MGSPTSPTHGKLAALYRLRPNGFKGVGLNDVTWGAGYSGGGSSGDFEVVIDAEATPDTFKWRKNGGGWTATVAITGAAQTLSDSQTITFAATTGHTLADEWAIGNYDTELTTEAAALAQITTAAHRIMNPNAPPTWTDGGGANLLRVNNANGTGYFDAAVGAVTLSGNNGYVLRSSLELCGYLVGWDLSIETDFADATPLGSNWETQVAGETKVSGSAEGFFIAVSSFFESFEDTLDGTQAYFFLEFFSWDVDQDQTGDHIQAWGHFNSFGVNAPIAEVVKETINFKIAGMIEFTADS